MKRKAAFLKNIPPVWTIIVFLLIYSSMQVPCLIAWHLGKEVGIRSTGPRCVIVLIFTIFYAFWRVYSFYPNPNGSYGKWLSNTPWQYGKKLPAGAIAINITDIVIVASICMLESIFPRFSPLIPATVFIVAYTVALYASCLMSTESSKYPIKKILFWIIIPFAFFPYPGLVNSLIVIFICWLISHLLLLDTLKEYPWNQDEWLKHNSDNLTNKNRSIHKVGWPYFFLSPETPIKASRKKWPLVFLCAIITWWLHAGMTFISTFDSGLKNNSLCFIVVIFITSIVVLCRLLFLQNTASPISFFGKIFSGHWLIPKFDKIFVAPIVAILICIIAISFMPKNTGYAILVSDLAIFLILLSGFAIPPSLTAWTYTGGFRLRRNLTFEKQSMQQAKNNGSINIQLFVKK